MDGDAFLTVREVAERIGASTQTVYRLIGSGELEAVCKRGCSRGWRVRESALARWAREGWEPVRPRA